jgi:hypothetical protein
MNVIAKKGTQCPKEGRPREYITDSIPVEVPGSTYYRRLVNDGSLEIVSGRQSAVSDKKTKEKLKADSGPLSAKDKGGKKS